jgi:hypothetical protein
MSARTVSVAPTPHERLIAGAPNVPDPDQKLAAPAKPSISHLRRTADRATSGDSVKEDDAGFLPGMDCIEVTPPTRQGAIHDVFFFLFLNPR